MEVSQVKEIEAQMHEMAIRKEQMQELCKRKDRDVFDIVYNVSGNLKNVDPTLEERLKERAIEGKKTYLDKTKTPQQQEENFSGLMVEIGRLYNRAFALMLENIKAIQRQGEKRTSSSTNLRVNTAMENSMSAGTPMPEKEQSQVNQRNQKASVDNKKAKGKKTAVVEKVSFADIHSELESMNSNVENNDFNDEKYRAYNESVKNRANSHEKSQSASGMQQESAMQRSGPSFGSKKK